MATVATNLAASSPGRVGTLARVGFIVHQKKQKKG